MDKEKLAKHVLLCRKNLKSKRVKCCAECPFEEEIVGEYPWMKDMYEEKRKQITRGKKAKISMPMA